MPAHLLFVQVIPARLYRKEQPFGGASVAFPFLPGQKPPSPPGCCSVKVGLEEPGWRPDAAQHPKIAPGTQFRQ